MGRVASAGADAAVRPVAVAPTRVLIAVNAEWYFLSHRLALARALRDHGCEVVVAAAVERGQGSTIEAEGLRFVPLQLRRRSKNPFREARSVLELFHLYRRERPDLVHQVTIKPVIYGSLAARWARVPAILNAIPGLGYAFRGGGTTGRIIRRSALAAYRVALRSDRVGVIFQNPDDLETFASRRLVERSRSWVIRGAGVDTATFTPSPPPEGTAVVLFASRLLWDKGLGELVTAVEDLRRRGAAVRVRVVGQPDDANPRAIPRATIARWHDEGKLDWVGLRDDMPAQIAGASIVALPTTYPEGVPKILLEAAACGRPIVATDVPGCREIVRNGENGLLVPPRDPQALASAVAALLADRDLRARMGCRGREIAVAEFSQEVVIGQTLDVYRELLGERWPSASVGGGA